MMDAAERALLTDTMQAALADAGDRADAVLAELGWAEMLRAEPDDAIAIVFGALGTTGAPSSALDDVLASALGVADRPDLAVILPEFGTWEPAGGAGLATRRAGHASELLCVRRSHDEVRVECVPAERATITPVRGLDPALGLYRVDAPAVGAGEAVDGSRWDDAVALGRRAIASEMLGACRVMLELARTHAVERVQFDRPIAHFQAVRHRLAESLVAVEALDAALGAASDEPGSITAALAKAVAGRSAATVVAHCQQVLAGIGFTTDHRFHCFMKRTLVLDGVLGNAESIEIELGRRLLARRRVPTLIEL